MAHRRRPKVTWKDPVSRIPVAQPLPHIPEVQLAPELAEQYAAALTVGSLWTLSTDVKVMNGYPAPRYKQHEFPYVEVAGYYDYVKLGVKGTLAVYMGTIRVEEVSNHNRTVSVPRHSFLINGARYLTRDLTLFVPAA